MMVNLEEKNKKKNTYYNCKKKYNITNAVCKLWEIFKNFSKLIPRNNSCNAFHMATVMATCGINGNCVIKHFLPYINSYSYL